MTAPLIPDDLDVRIQNAVQFFWDTRASQRTRQGASGLADVGTRSEVTGGAHMAALEALIAGVLLEAVGLRLTIIGGAGSEGTRAPLELPGYYRPEKRWDMLVLSDTTLVAAIELKAQVGPSFGNNANNRAEEALGNAEDIWKAVREERFGRTAATPFVGFVFLLEDCPQVHAPVRLREPHFEADPVFIDDESIRLGVSYASRYETLLRRLRLEMRYTATCLLLATKASPTLVTEPAEDLSMRSFISALVGHAATAINL